MTQPQQPQQQPPAGQPYAPMGPQAGAVPTPPPPPGSQNDSGWNVTNTGWQATNGVEDSGWQPTAGADSNGIGIGAEREFFKGKKMEVSTSKEIKLSGGTQTIVYVVLALVVAAIIAGVLFAVL